VRSVFNDEKKLSIAALSQTLPERLIEQTTPWSARARTGEAGQRQGALDLVVGLPLRRVGFRKPLEKLINIGFVLQVYSYRL
jgi:hypothetical protein